MFLRVSLALLATVGLHAVHLLAAEPKPAKMRNDVYYLASDKLRGRGAGTPELEQAADYIARRFAKIGLRPVSAQGYLQPVPLQVPVVTSIDLTLHAGSRQFTLWRGNASSNANAGLELASTPVIKLDADYAKTLKGSDLHGKLVVATSPLPAIARDVTALLVPFLLLTSARRLALES